MASEEASISEIFSANCDVSTTPSRDPAVTRSPSFTLRLRIRPVTSAETRTSSDSKLPYANASSSFLPTPGNKKHNHSCKDNVIVFHDFRFNSFLIHFAKSSEIPLHIPEIGNGFLEENLFGNKFNPRQFLLVQHFQKFTGFDGSVFEPGAVFRRYIFPE